MKGESEGRGAVESSRVFTAYVRAPDPQDRDVAPVLTELRRALRSEIRRRGLWETSPSYLGVYGAERWHGGTVADLALGLGGGPLDELLADCFSYIFVDRLRSLSAQLKVKDDVEGLVYLNVRHFVHERQRDCDPLGTRVYQVLHRAVQAAVDAGELEILAGDSRIRNDTLLTFDAGTEDVPADRRAERLARRVARWCDDLLPDLITATGRREDPLVDRLRARLPELWDDGFNVLPFHELIDPLKAEVRGRWATILGNARERLGIAGPPGSPPAGRSEGGESGEPGERFPAADPEPLPDLAFEQRDRFRALVACVVRSLAQLPGDERSRRTIEKLWGYLRVWSAEGGLMGDRLPSNRELALRLGLPRERIPGALETIRSLIDGCRTSKAGSLGRDVDRPETPRPDSH